MSKKQKDEVTWWEQEDSKEICEACGCDKDVTKHHLIPVSQMKNKYSELKPSDNTNVILLCRSCHDQVHALFSESDLRDLYSTKDALLNEPRFKKYVEWKKKHPSFTGHSKMSNDHRRRR